MASVDVCVCHVLGRVICLSDKPELGQTSHKFYASQLLSQTQGFMYYGGL